MRRQVLSILVENTSGVLSRVSGLFSRRGYNVDSITAGVTTDPRYTRMTIVTSGDELILEQIEKQLAKLEDVIDIKQLRDGESVCRELILVKVHVSRDSMVIELTGGQGKLDAFLELMAGYEILELARTGITGLTRGSADVTYLD